MGELFEPDDSIEQFVEDLHQLWVAAGKPTWSSLARKTHASKTSLNDATRRRDRLPSEYVVTELVNALAPADVGQWQRRRNELESTPSLKEPAPGDVTTFNDQSLAPPRNGHRRWVLLTVGISLVCALAGFAAGAMVYQPSKATAAVSAVTTSTQRSSAAHDGSDPIAAGCVSDAVAISTVSSPRAGTLKVFFSDTCDAYWAWFKRTDGHSVGNHVDIALTQDGNPSRVQRSTEPNVDISYTDMLLRGSSTNTYCALATVWTRTARLTVGPAC